jgi:hypothetical protein
VTLVTTRPSEVPVLCEEGCGLTFVPLEDGECPTCARLEDLLNEDEERWQ